MKLSATRKALLVSVLSILTGCVTSAVTSARVETVLIGTTTQRAVFETKGPRPQPFVFDANLIPVGSQCELRIVSASTGEILFQQLWIQQSINGAYQSLPGTVKQDQGWWLVPGQYYAELWVNSGRLNQYAFSIEQR